MAIQVGLEPRRSTRSLKRINYSHKAEEDNSEEEEEVYHHDSSSTKFIDHHFSQTSKVKPMIRKRIKLSKSKELKTSITEEKEQQDSSSLTSLEEEDILIKTEDENKNVDRIKVSRSQKIKGKKTESFERINTDQQKFDHKLDMVREILNRPGRIHASSYHTSHLNLSTSNNNKDQEEDKTSRSPSTSFKVKNGSNKVKSSNKINDDDDDDQDEIKFEEVNNKEENFNLKDNHIDHLKSLRFNLLNWFDLVKDFRQMPWRKNSPIQNSDLLIIQNQNQNQNQNNQDKLGDFFLKDCNLFQQLGQRAYEVWVSEIMLQQTQVETVKSYYIRWMNRFPTIFDLAKSNIEEVNQYWQGLGYYSRASRLLSGSKKVVEKFHGILPDDPFIMQKEVDGVGPYSAGAIASIAYSKPVAMVDGNVHRVLSRLTGLYAPQAAKATTKFLWSLAAQLVPPDRPGDFNQALMELGATICKPREANCSKCPLNKWCRAYQESEVLSKMSTKSSGLNKCNEELMVDIEDQCDLCQPIGSEASSSTYYSSSSQHILIYPMAKERKKPTIREVAVGVVIWNQIQPDESQNSLNRSLLSTGKEMTLLIKRPEKGLLPGLWEFPSIDLPESNDSTSEMRLKRMEGLLEETIEGFKSGSSEGLDSIKLEDGLNQINEEGFRLQRWMDELVGIEHVFSHLRVTYKPIPLLIHSSSLPKLKKVRKISKNDLDLDDHKLLHPHHHPRQAIWTPCSQILSSNIGNPHKKVWKALQDLLPLAPKP